MSFVNDVKFVSCALKENWGEKKQSVYMANHVLHIHIIVICN